ncbi:ABC transporter substrate-binding protein [Ideonella sp. DXS29W]|uniref:ABC transporter substrate-binding protein n=1 Tax=Ideonella lacteola TaxID=2984193 RepID=A0ABU9BX07_9BURK
MLRRTLLKQSLASTAALAFPAIAQSRPLVIGQSAAFTGPAAQLGVQMNAGAKLWFDQVNANGGINGQQIELRTADDGYEPDRCKANTEKFIKDDVFALFGYVGTPTCAAALPLINQARMPLFAPFTGAEILRDPSLRSVFHVRASYYDETELIIKQLASLGLTKIAVFYQNDAYGKAGLEGTLRALRRRSLEPVATATVERNSVDVAKAVAEIMPKQPNAVVQISAYKSCAAFIRESRKAGFGGSFFNVSFVGTQALADELKADGAGVMISQVMPFPYTASLPVTREFQAAAAKTGVQVNYSSLEGYLAAKVFTEGLRRTQRSASRDQFIESLESIQRQDFGGFVVDFGPRDHVASSFVDLSMLTGDGKVRR